MLLEHTFMTSRPAEELRRSACSLLHSLGFRVEDEGSDQLVFFRGAPRPRLISSVLDLPQIVVVQWKDQMVATAAHIEPYRQPGDSHRTLLATLLASLAEHLGHGEAAELAAQPLIDLEKTIRREDEYRRAGRLILLVGGALVIGAIAVYGWIRTR